MQDTNYRNKTILHIKKSEQLIKLRNDMVFAIKIHHFLFKFYHSLIQKTGLDRLQYATLMEKHICCQRDAFLGPTIAATDLSRRLGPVPLKVQPAFCLSF